MNYYIFVEDNERINGCGQCRVLNDNITNVEVEEGWPSSSLRPGAKIFKKILDKINNLCYNWFIKRKGNKKMTKNEIYTIIKDLVDYTEYKNGYVEQFYEVESYNEDYNKQKELFFKILKKALDISE